MPIEFNHTLIAARDPAAAAGFVAEILGLSPPRPWGPFQVVTTDNGVNLDFMQADGEIERQHYAFLVGEAEFDAIFARIEARGMTYWADPRHAMPGEINTHDGGRGFYFDGPDGHNLEVITRPYGSGGWNP